MAENYIKLNAYIPFTSLYAYIDTYETTEQTIRMIREAGLKPISKGFFTKDGKPWTIRICRVLSKNADKLEKIFHRMKSIYGTDYEKYCDELSSMLTKVGVTI